MLQVRILQSEKADLELQVQQLQKEAAASASNTSFETANSPPKSLSSSAKVVEKIESDEDEPMETSKDKSNTEPTKEATSASPSKFDHARSPALLDNKGKLGRYPNLYLKIWAEILKVSEI